MAQPPTPVRITVADAVDSYLDTCRARVAVGSLSAASVDNYAQNLYHFVELLGGSVVLDDVSGEDIDKVTALFAGSADKRSGDPRGKTLVSQRIFRAALSAFFTEAKKRRWVADSPMEYATLKPGVVHNTPAKRKALSLEQAQAVLDFGAGPQPVTGTPRQRLGWFAARATLFVLLHTGVRNGELTAADRADFTPAAPGTGVGAFWVVHGKGGKDRVVPVPMAAWSALGELWGFVDSLVKAEVLTADQVPAVVSSRGKRVNRMWVNRVVESARENVLAEPTVSHLARDMVPHAMRHTAATLALASQDASLPQIRDLLGHSNVAITSAYLDSDGEALTAVSEALGNRLE